MSKNDVYNGNLTAEQFLFSEMRIVAKFFCDGKNVDDIKNADEQELLEIAKRMGY